jgi:hypothetical protein
MKPHAVNDLDNFIMGWYLDPIICDKLIDHHNSNKTFEGRTSFGIDKSKKDSLDCHLFGDLKKEYVESIQPMVELYYEKYKYSNNYAPWTIIEPINIQKYLPNGGYHEWHTERHSGTGKNAARHLTFMTYLNDIDDRGETEFFYQNVKIKPEKGLTIFWGTDWTFTHRGIASPTQTKYIATGWYSFTK